MKRINAAEKSERRQFKVSSKICATLAVKYHFSMQKVECVWDDWVGLTAALYL